MLKKKNDYFCCFMFDANHAIVLAPAKINFFLSIEGQRFDNYHEVCTLMYPVSLYDSIIFNFNNTGSISVVCKNPLIPNGSLNLIYKAVELFFDKVSSIGLIEKYGVDVCLDKKIPVGAGFGGGSSDAASTLLLLNKWFCLPFSRIFLMNMCVKLGADVPFFILGKPSIAFGIGDRIEIFNKNISPFALLVYPNVSISTRCVYKNMSVDLNLGLTKNKKKISSFFLDKNFNSGFHLFNDMEATSETKVILIRDVKRLLSSLGAVGVLMSGSGSGVFGIFDDFKIFDLAYEFFLNCSDTKGWLVFRVNLLD